MRLRQPFRHAILDLDSTLTDSLATLAVTRSEHLRRLAESTGVPQSELMLQARELLRADFHNPEMIDRLPAIQRWRLAAGGRAAAALDDEREFYRESIERASRLLPRVAETLRELRRRSVDLVIWSNKKSPYTRAHLLSLGLDGLVDAVYCPVGPDPQGRAGGELSETRVVEIVHEERKPNMKTARRIVLDNRWDEDHTLLIGNNIRNDGGSTIEAAIRFVLVDFGVPSIESQNAVFELTGSERLSYNVGGRLRPDYEFYVANVKVTAKLTRNLSELLDYFEPAPSGGD